MALLHAAHGPHAADQRAKQRHLLDLEGVMMAGGGIAGRLYRGDVSINFVRRQRTWYAISGAILLISVIALLVKGLNYSLEFKGGSSFTFPPTASTSQDAISRVVNAAGGNNASVQYSASPSLHQWTVQTGALTSHVSQQVTNALASAFHLLPSSIAVQFVGPTWGSQITSKAVEALIIFLVVIVIYLSIAFEWRMAVAAFVALMHDILITVGVYALTGFTVSPTSVIGLLTILGYSLYDTVVVFDKVRENTAGLLTTQRSTYSDAANLALNQTLVRSINTSTTALLPVASILFVGAGLLGAGTLKDLALVLFVGMLSGTYSSIFIATPVLADLKEREPQYKDLAAKVGRRLAGGRSTQRDAAGGATAATATAPAAPGTPFTVASAIEPDASSGPEDQDTDETAEQDAVDGVAVSAAARTGDTPPRPVTRQQRVTGGAQRRPGARKKRR
jgi:preprotein translocase subunit SecF